MAVHLSSSSHAGPVRGGVVRRLVATMWHTPWTFTLAMVATVAITVFEVAIPMLTASAVDTATGALDGEISTVIYVLVAVALARYVFQFCRRYTAGRLANLLSARLRVRILDSLQSLDGKGQDQLRTGQIVSRSISDLNMTQTMVAMMPLILGNVLKFFVVLGMIIWLDPLLSLVALAVIPLLIWLTVRSRKVLFAATWSAQQAVAELATHVEETVTGVRVVKAFAQEDNETARLNQLSRAVYAQMMRQAKLQARYQPLAQLIPGLALIMGIGLGGYLAIGGQITIGIFFAFTAYITTVTMVTGMIAGMVVQIQLGLASAQRVFEVIDLQPHRPDPVSSELVCVPAGPLGMTLHGVGFSVESVASDSGMHTVLDNFSLSVAAGETVALVGPPGSGKSMAVQLMTGFYDPDAGSISVDGQSSSVPISSISRADLRAAVSAVFDEPFLYSASIRENITMGADASDEDVEAAARAAQAHEFITELPGGYDEVVGERGLTLSGGQRQRIAIARALFARPRILILDDATSAIDATTERAIYEYLSTELASTTIIAVAHRESTLQLADRIALVDAGHVIDHGPLQHMHSNPEFVRLMDARKHSSFRASEDESVVVLDSPDLDEPTWDELWPEIAPAQSPHGDNKALRRAAASGMGAGRRGGGGRHGGMSGSAAATPASEELLERVAALPPATSAPPTSGEEFRKELDHVNARSLFGHVVWLIVAVIGLYVVSVLTSLAFPTLVRTAIDDGVTPGNTSVLWWVVGVGVIIAIVGWLATIASTIVTMLTGERLLYELRIRSYAHLQRLSMSFYERTMSGTIMTRMTTDIDALSNFLRTGMADTVAAAATLVGIVALLAYTSPSLALIALLAVPIVAVATYFFRRVTTRLYTQAREEVSAVNAMFHESIAGLRTSQLHGMESLRLSGFAAQTEKFTRTRIKAQTAVAIYFPGINALSELTSAAVLGAGAVMVTSGDIAAGVLVAFLLYLGRLFGPIQQLSQVFDSYQQAQVGFRRITDLLRTSPDVTDLYTETGSFNSQLSDDPNVTPSVPLRPLGPRSQADRLTASAATEDVHFVDVSFAYDKEAEEVLENFNLTIKAGTTVAVVGTTGAGKSTIIKLIERFYDPTSGSVRAGNVDIATMPLESWRRQIGFVPQEAHLFAGTIASNIAYGSSLTEALKEDITDAARRVGALHAIAAIPGGFNAEVGERGRGLSSGQRQLIALARAELMKPSIMLLDEATATLDPATEKAILAASENVMHERTSIVVAHRLATAARADRIIVIDNGQIVEDGTHEQLLTFGGNYADMWGNKSE